MLRCLSANAAAAVPDAIAAETAQQSSAECVTALAHSSASDAAAGSAAAAAAEGDMRPGWDEERAIGEGDLLVVYEGHDSMKAVRMSRKQQLQNRFGTFKHEDWVGRPYGSKVFATTKAGKGKGGSKGGGDGGSRGRAGFVYLLAPSAELWTKVLSHRTQVLYLPDIAFTVARLDLRPGSVVLESGTGSGSMTHALARAVAPTGHVHTFDFHALRAQQAQKEFAANGIGSVVTVGERDIQGLGFPSELFRRADAVFLDLPSPWLAVPSAAQCLKANGVLCSFSPCIEQVQRCCDMLRQQCFTDIRTFEVLMRSYDVREEYLSLPRTDVDAAHDTDDEGHEDTEDPSDAVRAKRRRRDGTCESKGAGEQGLRGEKKQRQTEEAVEEGERAVLAMRPTPITRGHTGYLTFARLWVS